MLKKLLVVLITLFFIQCKKQVPQPSDPTGQHYLLKWDAAISNGSIDIVPTVSKTQQKVTGYTIFKSDGEKNKKVIETVPVNFRLRDLPYKVIMQKLSLFAYFEKHIYNKEVYAQYGYLISGVKLQAHQRAENQQARGVTVTEICVTMCGVPNGWLQRVALTIDSLKKSFTNTDLVLNNESFVLMADDSINVIDEDDFELQGGKPALSIVNFDLEIPDEAISISLCRDECQFIFTSEGGGGGGSSSSTGTGNGGSDYANLPGAGYSGNWYEAVALAYPQEFIDKFNKIAAIVPNLSFEQKQWLLETPGILDALLEMIAEDEGDPESSLALRLTIAVMQKDKLEAPLTEQLALLENNQPEPPFYLGPSFIIPDILGWQINMQLKAAIIKEENPTWSKPRVYYEANKELFHDVLAGFGLIPIIGEIADLTDGLLYSVEGDGVNATLSVTSAIPFYGWGAAGVRIAKRFIQTTSGKVYLIWKKVGGVIKFSDRRQLRKVLNMGPISIDKRIAHHIIPVSLAGLDLVQKAAQIVVKNGKASAFHINEALNGIPLDAYIHAVGKGHEVYTAKVRAKLRTVWENKPSMSSSEAIEELEKIINSIREQIVKNPGIDLNELNF